MNKLKKLSFGLAILACLTISSKAWAMKDIIACGLENGTIEIWNISDMENPTCNIILEGHSDKIKKVTFNPSKKFQLASCSQDQTIKIWDLSEYFNDDNTDSELINTLRWEEPSNKPFHSITFNPHDGKQLAACADQDNRIKIFDIYKPSAQACIKILAGHRGWVRTMEFNPEDKKQLASGSEDGTIKIWDLCRPADQDACAQTLTGHTETVNCIKYNPFNSNELASCSDDNTIKIWDIKAGYCKKTFRGHKDIIKSIEFSPHNKNQLFSCSFDNTVIIWDISKPEDHTIGFLNISKPENTCKPANPALIKTLKGHNHWVYDLKINPYNPDELVSCATNSKNGEIISWNLSNPGLENLSYSTINTEAPVSIAFSPKPDEKKQFAQNSLSKTKNRQLSDVRIHCPEEDLQKDEI